MSSILTNTSAMVALQTLRGINSNMAEVQSQISTGKSVATARDNAAVWAISKTMESDVKGFSGISDSLALGRSTVAVGRQAAETVTDLLTQMKGHIVAAQEDNVDRAKIQTDVDALREQIRSVVGAAQFNGLNMVNNADETDVLSSLDRDAQGNITTSTITVAHQDLGSNNDPLAGDAFGEGETIAEVLAVGDDTTITITDDAGEVGAQIVLNIGDRQVSYTVTESDVNGGGDAENNIAAGLRAAIQNSGIALYNDDGVNPATPGIEIELDGDELTLTNRTAAELTVTARAQGPGAGGLSGLAAIDVASPAGATSALAEIDALIETAIDAAAAFGSVQGRLDTQAEFVKNLTDSLTTGIGSLVDADMEATSARLQALQVQQQLATQSLSIANQGPQNVLALFR